ncbi:hypothetical protein EVAR_65484_1 [Eumeta japonica]|uniref:Uncharacterized protein n=1 Tax=Eumeta variegata TaxID=151549 RepID=A0A4C2A8R4_EUMVA|nr:hypothetical protein EVAR_65484_1 [Eumeta japonica]
MERQTRPCIGPPSIHNNGRKNLCRIPPRHKSTEMRRLGGIFTTRTPDGVRRSRRGTASPTPGREYNIEWGEDLAVGGEKRGRTTETLAHWTKLPLLVRVLRQWEVTNAQLNWLQFKYPFRSPTTPYEQYSQSHRYEVQQKLAQKPNPVLGRRRCAPAARAVFAFK